LGMSNTCNRVSNRYLVVDFSDLTIRVRE
jgi:hypothetical protein